MNKQNIVLFVKEYFPSTRFNEFIESISHIDTSEWCWTDFVEHLANFEEVKCANKSTKKSQTWYACQEMLGKIQVESIYTTYNGGIWECDFWNPYTVTVKIVSVKDIIRKLQQKYPKKIN